MTDHEKLLCALLGVTDEPARDDARDITTSPLRVVAVMLGRHDIDPRAAV